MRTLIAVCTAACFCGASLSVWAQGINPSMRPTSFVQLQVQSGRLTLVARGAARTRTSNSTSAPDRRERMSIDLTGLDPAVDYELVTAQSQVTISARNRSHFRLAREVRGANSAAPFEFRQDPAGQISFRYGAGDEERQREFPTIWHLLLSEGDAAKTHVLPMLEFFRPGWNLSTTVDHVTDALFAHAAQQQEPPRQRWTGLVAQLADADYSRREAAERLLRAEGKAILSFLDELKSSPLDFEQRHRVRRIRYILTRGEDDNAPESVANWLAADPRAWHALLNHPDQARRRTAAEQLARLLGEPIVFDAGGDIETRRRQIEALRIKLDGGHTTPSNQAASTR